MKGLMQRQKLTQQALAEKAGLGVATIKRICSGKDMAKGQRRHTLSALSKALRVEEAVLTAADLPPSEEGDHLKSAVQLKASVNRQTDLSFQAVEAIYGISRSAQIAMAPLFAALIAEASLKWRKERLDAIDSIADRLDAMRGDNPLLNGAFSRTWEAEKVEQKSIEQKDVLGHRALKELKELSELAGTGFGMLMDHDVPNALPYEWVSPFLTFLKEFRGSFGQPDIKIDLNDEDGDPQIPRGIADYQVGENFIAEICGENMWARIAIEFGHISISDIPKELLGPTMATERQAYLASAMSPDKRRQHAKSRVEEAMSYLEAQHQFRLENGLEREADSDTLILGQGQFNVTDELIRHELEILDQWGR
jgi:transcriptional regulator with XRE-family HTH domain